MAQHKAQKGDSILIKYVCRSPEGELYEEISEPSPILLGNENVLPALEKKLLQMSPGETCMVQLKPSQAFGPVYDDLFLEVPMEMFADGVPELGETVEVAEDGEDTCPGTVVEINEDSVLVDCNHPMAGKVLVFELTFVGFSANE